MPYSVVTNVLRAPRIWWALACAVLLDGCSNLPMEKYSFQDLPSTYVATRRENPHTLDLTKMASATRNSDIIDRGDVLDVSISASLNSKDTVAFPVRVHENGMGQLPVIGAVPLAGMELEAAEAAIVSACIERELYRSPHVTVTMKKQKTNKIRVFGAVKEPNTYELPRGQSDLLAAISAAGGLDKDAGTIVEIRNPNRAARDDAPAAIAGASDGDVNSVGHSTFSSRGMSSVRVDLISATSAGSGQYLLEDGGMVHVEKRDPEPIFVQGLVMKPDRYEYPPAEELRLLGAISMAGGISNGAADQVYVIRHKPNSGETFVVNLKISDAKRNEKANLLLAPGDVVSVEQTPGTMVMDVFRRLNIGLGATLPLTTFFGL